MKISVITLFPDLVKGVVAEGVVGRAHTRGLIQLECVNPRDFAGDVHRTVDDKSYGGGPGMVMRADCLAKAIRQQRCVVFIATIIIFYRIIWPRER